jgi:N-formylglutamate amidohydrolase
MTVRRSPQAPFAPDLALEASPTCPGHRIGGPHGRGSAVVFSSPHSGRIYPNAFLETVGTDLLDLRRIEDAYLDLLLTDVEARVAPVICGLIGRSVIDLNRDEDDMDPAMFSDPRTEWSASSSRRVQAGLGCLPRIARSGEPIYQRLLLRAEAEDRISRIHRPYHQALEDLLERARTEFGEAWLIDCHSMPSRTPDGGRAPDVVIGDLFGRSCGHGLAAHIETLFRSRGYTTARNVPYAGGYATARHGRPELGRHAVQIELRRGLYLDEEGVEPHEGLNILRRDLTAIAELIVSYAEDRLSPAPRGKRKRPFRKPERPRQ